MNPIELSLAVSYQNPTIFFHRNHIHAGKALCILRCMEFEQLGLIHHNPQVRTAKEHDGLLNEIRGNQSLVIAAPRSRTLPLMQVREFRELPPKDRRFVFFFADGSPACAVEVEDVAISKLGSCDSLFVGAGSLGSCDERWWTQPAFQELGFPARMKDSTPVVCSTVRVIDSFDDSVTCDYDALCRLHAGLSDRRNTEDVTKLLVESGVPAHLRAPLYAESFSFFDFPTLPELSSLIDAANQHLRTIPGAPSLTFESYAQLSRNVADTLRFLGWNLVWVFLPVFLAPILGKGFLN